MSTFRVGQRVRVVVAIFRPEIAGREGTITSDLQPGFGINSNRDIWGYEVDIDGFGRLGPSGYPWMLRPWQLEPIQPERNQTIAWEECICGPDGKMREGLAA